MQIQIFTICDNAQVYQGKAVVVGAFNSIRAKDLPIHIPNLTVALRIAYEPNETGEKIYKIDFIAPSGKNIIETLMFKQTITTKGQDDFATVDFNLGLTNLILNEEGTYKITLHTDDIESIFKFVVKKI